MTISGPRRRWGEISGWIVVAAVILAAARPPRQHTLGWLGPVVDAGVRSGSWIRDRAAELPVSWLWIATVVSALMIVASVVGRHGRFGYTLGTAAGGIGFVTAWIAAAAGRPGWTVIAGGVAALGVVMGTTRDPGGDPTRVVRVIVPWIVVVAAVLRLWSLEALPPGFGTHGTTHLAVAVDLLDGARDALLGGEVPPSVWLAAGGPVAWVEQHGPLAVVHAVGFGLLGVGPVEARMTSALLGIATVWLVAVCGGWIGDRWSGVAAAALLAVAPWHVAFSRGNDAEHVLSPLHAVLALGLLVRAMRRGRWVDWIVSGAVMGLSAYVYAPNQLVPLAGAVMLVAGAATVPGSVRRDAWRVGAAVVVASIVAGPHLAAWAASPVPLPIRSSIDRSPDGAYAVSRPDDLGPNLVASASQLLVASDDEWLTVPTGMVGPTTAAAWLVGLVACASMMRRPRYRFAGLTPLALLGIGLLPGVLSAWVFARRLVLAATAIELIAGAGVVAVIRALRWRRLPVSVCALVVVVGSAVHTVTGMSVYVRTVKVPESLGSTVLPAIARVITTSVPRERVVVAIAPDEPYLDIEDALLIGAAPAVRPLIAAGYRRDDVWRVVTFDGLGEVLDEFAAEGRAVRVVVPSPGSRTVDESVLAALDGRGAGPPQPVSDVRELVVAWTWSVPPAGMSAGGAAISSDVPDSPGA